MSNNSEERQQVTRTQTQASLLRRFRPTNGCALPRASVICVSMGMVRHIATFVFGLQGSEQFLHVLLQVLYIF